MFLRSAFPDPCLGKGRWSASILQVSVKQLHGCFLQRCNTYLHQLILATLILAAPIQPLHHFMYSERRWICLQALFLISIVLGAVACGSSLLLLWAALDSWNPDGIFAHFHLPGQPYGHITTLIYLKVCKRPPLCRFGQFQGRSTHHMSVGFC